MLKNLLILSILINAISAGLNDWALCSASSLCNNLCCSKNYSADGKYKCTPGISPSNAACLQPGVTITTAAVSGTPTVVPPTTTAPAPTGTANLADWALCTFSTQCRSRCCSGYSSGGVLKCTPGISISSIHCTQDPKVAGRYEFYGWAPDVSVLVGVLPRNNRVIMQGRLPNSPKFIGFEITNNTHSYEFDYTTGNYHEQHVSTSPYCAAGMIFPDNLGRMATFGGYTGADLTPIRTYKPSGGPGSVSTTDWEENSSVRMKVPRWYATVLTHGTGEVFIIGGAKSDSDKTGQASIEFLPPRAGNPIPIPMLSLVSGGVAGYWATYPLAYTMPSGRLFLFAGVQSRLLSTSDFSVAKTLPDIPGGRGRSWPCNSGHTMLPMSSPFNNPEIIVCGGCGNDGTGNALNTCGRMFPESASPAWAMENMPGNRVIGNLVQLPDGKLLMVNGVSNGMHGWALGNNPTYTAWIYDPEAPAGSRWTIGGFSNIPRVYHNVAQLLPNGKVMIAGSDPLDVRYPSDFRVEMYVPPYLLNGKTRPTFSLSNGRDFGYGSTININANLGTASPSRIRINIMKASVNTHSISFEQRFLWLQYTRSGNNFAISVPSNNMAAPPGWYALHIVVDGTPSQSTWIRIGGDPKGIYKWPVNPSFSLAGLGASVTW